MLAFRLEHATVLLQSQQETPKLHGSYMPDYCTDRLELASAYIFSRLEGPRVDIGTATGR